MKPEKSTVEMEKSDSPPMQEVEFALILARMIDAVKSDPVQLRTAVYEFARSRLNNEISWADETEQERIRVALETAIKGVEDFSARRDETEKLLSGPSQARSDASRQIASSVREDRPAAQVQVLPPVRISEHPERPRYARRNERAPGKFLSPVFRLAAGLLVAGALASGAIYGLRHNASQPPKGAVVAAKPSFAARSGNIKFSEAATPETAVPAQKSPFPLPTVYGVYALVGDALKEMDVSFEPIPDKRIGISSPINTPSNLILPDGRVRFVVYRRDIAASAPERIEVRVVAAVKRAMVFDPKGKGHFVPVNNEWSMRNISYQLRVRPVPQSQEMLLIESENPDFQLAPGRYALILKNQGYDFTVAGTPTDLVQCLERTDAANGSFFTDCRAP
ncbi:MAG: hypothetical protein K2W78_16470 [Xanthobacteraceae bacterium]|nr:hypothetical protein [Xanthobacteraceae bacterium]